MPRKKQELRFSTPAQVKAIKLLESGPSVYHTYAPEPHLKLHVQQRLKVWRFVKRVDGVSHDRKLGVYPALRFPEARKLANDMLAAIQRGEYRVDGEIGKSAADLTLADGYAIVRERLSSEETLRTYKSVWTHHFPDHLRHRKMVMLATEYETVRLWHEKLKAHSLGVASISVALLRSIYSHSRKRFPTLPTAPIITLDLVTPPRGEYDHSRTALATHLAAVAATKSPVRRGLADFIYYSGQRIDAAKHTRWEWVQQDRITFPAAVMKGKKPFVLPLSDELHAVLAPLRC